MKIIKKLLLPFFQEQHKFLLGKWWFRFLIILYPITLVATAIYLFSDFMNSYLNCYDIVIKIFTWGSDEYNREFALCKERVINALPQATGYAFVLTLLIHYAIQALFFKVVIDFIMMNRYKKV